MNDALRALHSSESNEWYTPEVVVEIARRTMGTIDLDPASCPAANERIGATHYFTIDTNGLTQRWFGRVWLNPPYGRGERNKSNQELWTRKLLSEFEAGHVREAVLLVNATTDRRWFRPLWRHVVCFAYRRVRFVPAAGAKHSPTHGNVLVYFGHRSETFIAEADNFGHLVRPAKPMDVFSRRTPVRSQIIRTPVRVA